MITTASARPILPKDPIFHIMNMSGRNYHRRTSSCFPYNHMTMTANPSMEIVPLKCWELQELKQFHSFTVGQVFFSSFPLSLLSAITHVLIFSFIIHIFPLLLTAGGCQNLPYTAVEEISYISTSLEWMMTLYGNTGLRRRINSSLLPTTWFHSRKLHQQHNYLYSHRLFEIQSP